MIRVLAMLIVAGCAAEKVETLPTGKKAAPPIGEFMLCANHPHQPECRK